MVLRTQALFFGLVSLLASQLTLALGLGEIKLNSFLNQPLDAEIELVQIRGLTENEIRVGLGSPEDFQQAGVDRPFFLVDLKFEVELQNPAGPIIKVTSLKSVREPFLDFIVKIEWPSGKLLREYTVLMDLPVFSDEPARAVQAPSSQQQTRPSQTQQPATRPTTAAPSQQTPSSVTRAGDGTYTVRANDTLWGIAANAKPDSGVTIQQTMLAIQRLNPDAFINGNINLLKRGKVLRLPEYSDIDLSTNQAVREVASQNREFSNETGAQLEGSKQLRETPSSAQREEGYVKLSTADEASSLDGRGAGAGSGDADALRSQLTNTEEELAASERENVELKSRLAAMDDQIQTMEKLLAVSNEEMKQLELALQKLRQEEGESGLTDDAEATETTGELDPVEGTGDGLTEEGEEASSETDAAESDAGLVTPPPAEEPKVEEKPQPQPTFAGKPKKSFIDIIMDYLYYIIGAALLVIAGAVYFLVSRNSGFDDDDDDFDDEPSGVGFDDDDDFEPQVGGDTTQIHHRETDSVEASEDDAGNVISEADIHIAYSNFDSAEELLVKAVGEEPQNEAYNLKLLEVYSKSGNVEAFDRYYSSLHSFGSEDGLSQAAAMRSNIEGAGEFDLDAIPADVSLDDLAAELSEIDVTQPSGEQDLAGDDDVNDFSEDSFTLDLDEASETDDTVLMDSEDDTVLMNPDAEALDELELGDLAADDTSEKLEEFEFEASLDDSSNTEEIASDDTAIDYGELGALEDSDESSESTLEMDSSDEILEGLEELSIDQDADTQVTSAITDEMLESVDSAETDLGSDDLELSSDDLTIDNDELGLTESVELVAESDTETQPGDLTLDEDLDLQSLDQELDQLASEFEGDLADLEETHDIESSAELGDSDVGIGDVGLEIEPADKSELELDSSADIELDGLDLESGDDLSELSLDAGDSEISLDADGLASDGASENENGSDNVIQLAEITSAAKGVTVEDDLLEVGGDKSDVDSGEELLGAESDETISANASDSEDDLTDVTDSENMATKLDLLRVFVDMGDSDSAMNTLEEIMEAGDDNQKKEAERLVAQLG